MDSLTKAYVDLNKAVDEVPTLKELHDRNSGGGNNKSIAVGKAQEALDTLENIDLPKEHIHPGGVAQKS